MVRRFESLGTSLALAVTTLALLAFVSVPASAGGFSAKVEGPAKDGTYTVTAYSCHAAATEGVRAWAEGVVDGRRQTLPLTLTASLSPGTFGFTRTWPRSGRWVVRLGFNGQPALSAVAKLDRNGRVRDTQLIWDGDGRRECEACLASAVK